MPLRVLKSVKLPFSGGRQRVGFVKLLRRVPATATSGFDFDGTLFRAGRLVSIAELQPQGYPEVPVILECAGIIRPGRGHQRSEYQYLVWQWDPRRGDWFELARCASNSSDWAAHLAKAAHDAIEGSLPRLDLDSIAVEIRRFLDAELERVAADDRVRLLGVIHDELAVRLSGGGGWAPANIHVPHSPSITTTQ
jgi:hypothetical protein